MKKIPLCLTAIVFAFSLLVSGCSTDDDLITLDPEFLVGTWRNANAVFTIDADFNFECRIRSVSAPATGDGDDPGLVRGRLVRGGPLGPNSFELLNMEVGGPDGELDYPEAEYEVGNDLLADMVPDFNGIFVTLTPYDVAGTRFTFWSNNTAASMFFGAAGPFDKD